jgi:medium-chain acyl-[acyl-carrier-protein] hydrolase
MNRTDADRWLAFARFADGNRTNVFCFPFAGGGASFYRAWLPFAPPSIAICPLQPPGREERFVEKPFDAMESLVADAAAALIPHLDQPFALFGHSLGAMACFEIAHALRKRGAPMPVHLFVSGAPAPHLSHLIPSVYELPDDEFLAAVQRYGGLPDEVLRSRELLDLLIPRLRADFKISGTYRYAERLPLAIPITAFGGRDDDVVTPPLVEPWREHTTGTFQSEIFSGGHFFIAQHAREIVLKVARALA